jgi:hypothetical protein
MGFQKDKIDVCEYPQSRCCSLYVTAEYYQDADGYPKEMKFDFRDELTGEMQRWNWIAHPQGNLVDISLMQPQVAMNVWAFTSP